MTSSKTALALMAVAAGVAACGSTNAAKPQPVSSPVAATTVSAACNPTNPIPPKGQPKTPDVNSCWAGNFYVGEGSLHNKELIYVDKMATYSLFQLTPQLIRTDPARATFIRKVAALYLTTKAQQQIFPVINAEANSGDSLVTTGKNPADPTALLTNYPTVVAGGVADIPSSTATQVFKVGSTALVGECIDKQVYAVGPNQAPVSGINGYSGNLEWTDQLVKTSNGWQVNALDIAIHEVPSC